MWPTSRHEGFDAGAHRGNPDSLHSVVKMLPTPDAGMVQGGRSLPEGTSPTGMTPDGKKRQVGLTNAVKMLPTPRAMPGNHSNVNGKIYETSLQSMARKGILDDEQPQSMKLNPAWVSRMMGFPDGWMDDI
jgi:hypothetical protein